MNPDTAYNESPEIAPCGCEAGREDYTQDPSGQWYCEACDVDVDHDEVAEWLGWWEESHDV